MSNSSTSNSDRFGLKTAGFVGGAILAIVLLYQIGGFGRTDQMSWFRSVPSPAQGDTLDVLFLGSSRVAAAVDPATFDSAASVAARRPVRSFNLGMGFSTLQEAYFGLKSLARIGALRNRLVLFEAPGGVPRHSLWGEPWFDGDTRSMLSSYMEATDVIPMWTKAKMSTPDKILVTVEVLGGLRNNFWRLRVVAADRVRGQLHKVGSLFRPSSNHIETTERVELVFSRGGIRLDPSRIEKVRQSAVEMATAEASDQRAWTGWDSTVFRDIVDLVRSEGGEIGVFHMPIWSQHQMAYASPTRREGAKAFEAFRKQHGITLSVVDTTYGDDAYPDLWHMGIPVALNFSRKLAEALEYPRLDTIQMARRTPLRRWPE